MSVCLSVSPYTCQSVGQSFFLSFYRSICLFICPVCMYDMHVCLSLCLMIIQSEHLSVCLFIFPFACLSFICLSIFHLFVYPSSVSLSFICLSILHLFVYPSSVCLSFICFSILLPVFQSIHMPVCLSVIILYFFYIFSIFPSFYSSHLFPIRLGQNFDGNL